MSSEELVKEANKIKQLGVVGVFFSHDHCLVERIRLLENINNLENISKIVYERELHSGIKVRARSWGLFELDLRGVDGCYLESDPANILNSKKGMLDHATNSYPVIVNMLKYVNSFKACFVSMLQHKLGLSIYPIDPPDIPSEYIKLGGNLTLDNINNAYRQKIEKQLESLLIFEAQSEKHRVLTIDSLDFLVEQFDLVVTKEENFVDLIDLLYHQYWLYQSHRFSECLIGAWAIIEVGLQRQWGTYIDNIELLGREGELIKGVVSRRKQKLTGRDFTASVIQEILSLAGEFDYDMYVRLDETRKIRNKWMHELSPVTQTEAMRALELARDMIRIAWEIDLGVSLCTSFQL